MTAAPPLDLNKWHRALHEVTGRMSLYWTRATTADLYDWSAQLQSVAEEMHRIAVERHAVAGDKEAAS